MRAQRRMAWLAGLSIVLTLTACQKEKPLPEQRFDLHGKVVAFDPKEGTVTLAHDAIPGYMAAMTMAYPLKDKWVFNVLKPGQTLRATLVVSGDQAWLEGVVITEVSKPETNSLAPGARSPLGQELPDFPLTNQDGKRIHLHQYRGRALLLTFIYTRCPLPNYCPLMSKNFSSILEKVRSDQELSLSAHLLSISIDPEYDKPAVLRAYARQYAGTPPAFDQWEFATGTTEQVRNAAAFFGLSYWTEGGQVVHTLATALISPDGKVAKIYPGNEWQPDEVVADLRNLPRS
jgi:protein SCO1/2